MKNRLLFYTLAQYLEHKNALVVTGMRQVGKTTLLRQLFEKVGEKPKLFFDFDNPLEQKAFEDIDYNNIYNRLLEMVKAHKPAYSNSARLYIFLDEIQNFPEITKVIKYLIDHKNVKFIVTGSSSFYLKNLFPESLSGRKFLYTLSPLSFKEYLYFEGLITLKEAQVNNIESALQPLSIFQYKKYQLKYEAFLDFGGFPEVVTTDDLETKKLVLKNILTSFFEKDLRFVSDYSDIRELRDLILLLVPRVGSLLDITKLSSELGIDRPKIYRYIELLQATFLIRLLPKFSKSIDRSVAGGRKIYFTDTGLLRNIGRVNDGQLFENGVINELSSYGELSFYNKQGSEIDAILDQKIAFEIKLTGSFQDYTKLKRLSMIFGIPRHLVISKNFSEKEGIISALSL